jgi:hypothetical protein
VHCHNNVGHCNEGASPDDLLLIPTRPKQNPRGVLLHRLVMGRDTPSHHACGPAWTIMNLFAGGCRRRKRGAASDVHFDEGACDLHISPVYAAGAARWVETHGKNNAADMFQLWQSWADSRVTVLFQLFVPAVTAWRSRDQVSIRPEVHRLRGTSSCLYR